VEGHGETPAPVDNLGTAGPRQLYNAAHPRPDPVPPIKENDNMKATLALPAPKV